MCVSARNDRSVLIPSYLCNVIPRNYKRSFTNIRPNLYPLLDRPTVFSDKEVGAGFTSVFPGFTTLWVLNDVELLYAVNIHSVANILKKKKRRNTQYMKSCVVMA